MNLLKIAIFTVLIGVAQFTVAQEISFSFQLGAAIPLGDFAVSENNPDSGGFAVPGFDIRFIAAREFSNHFVVGANLGYSVYGMDKDAIKKAINPNNPEAVIVETQSFQNINLQARGGYNWEIIEDRLGILPHVDVGLGIFNSAYYAIQDGNGNVLLRQGNSGMAFLVTPGVEIWLPINSFVNIKAYGSYQFANYKVDEQFSVNGKPIPGSEGVVNYQYSALNLGLGASFVF